MIDVYLLIHLKIYIFQNFLVIIKMIIFSFFNNINVYTFFYNEKFWIYYNIYFL